MVHRDKNGLSEWLIHWIVWSFGVSYCLYRLAAVSKDLYPELHPGDFEDGWAFVGRKKDTSDLEWKVMKKAFLKYALWFLGHVILSQIFLIIRTPKPRFMFHTLYSQLCICNVLGYGAALCLNFLVFFMFLIHIFGKKLLCVLSTTCLMFIFLQPIVVAFKEHIVSGFEQRMLFEVSLVWLNARALSFAMDRIDQQKHRTCNLESILQILGYCFYLPAFFTGPLCLFTDYTNQVKNVKEIVWSWKCFKRYLFKFLRLLAPFFLLELGLHFIYSTAIQYYIVFVKKLSAWELCGLGYVLPCQFYLKYLVIYGFAGFLAELECINLPPPPRCISREHLCSRLWRYFDHGLHLWITKYIYKPLIGNHWNVIRRISACAVCFLFVSVWHGMDKTICMWCFLNFIGVSLEMLGAAITSTITFQNMKDDMLSANAYRRLCALIATPLFFMMCISCLFFLSNWDVGIHTVNKFMSGFPIPLLPTLFFMYCGSHVSLDVRDWEVTPKKVDSKKT